jgi:ABC-type spermidine/putrescine transport system permease subunit II
MTRPHLDTLLFVTLIASLISFGGPLLSVATLGRIRLMITATVAAVALVVTIATVVLAIAVHRKRGLWTILAAVPVLFWPVVIISFSAECAMYDCD